MPRCRIGVKRQDVSLRRVECVLTTFVTPRVLFAVIVFVAILQLADESRAQYKHRVYYTTEARWWWWFQHDRATFENPDDECHRKTTRLGGVVKLGV